MKIEKIVKIFAIVALTVGSVFTFSQTTEAATVSIEKAAQKIYKAETKAYDTKKDTSVTVKVAASSKAKKVIKKVTGELENALIKEELGDVDLTRVVRNTYVRPSIGHILESIGDEHSSEGSSWRSKFFYYPTSLGADQKVSYKSGVLTVKMSVKGSQKWYRDQYYENTCLAKCVAQLKEQTDGMSEKDKAWTIAQWVDEHVWYDGDYAGGMETKYSLIWKQEGAGVCEQQAIANQLFGCLMGLNTGYLLEGNHAANCVKIDGEIYIYDGTDNFTGDWEAFNKGQSNAAKISNIAQFKEWVDGTSIGEWCLLKPEEYIQCVTFYDDWDIFDSTVYWYVGDRFKGQVHKPKVLRDLV